MNQSGAPSNPGKRKEKMTVKEELTMLKVAAIYPHPDNPRKDVGDVTELADSIRKRGILQNLTVMPGHWLTTEEMADVIKAYKEDPTDELGNLIETKWSNEGYTTLIGHRRTAAAKLAGIEEAPCRIVTGLTKNEQITMMLEENMQRNDLTIYEQAESFQLMLDLGETVETLSEKTGFSKSTIYHRLNLAKLDRNLIREKEDDDSYQLSIKDMYELEKIKDVDKRNQILSKSTDSSNLKYLIEQSVREEERDKKARRIIARLEEMGVQQCEDDLSYWNSDYTYVATVSSWDLDEDDVKAPVIEDTTDVYYTYNKAIYIKRKVQVAAEESEEQDIPKEKTESEKLTEQIREDSEKLDGYQKSFKEHFSEFTDMTVQGDIEVKDDIEMIHSLMLIELQLGFEELQLEELYEIIDENYDDYDEDVPEEAEKRKIVRKAARELPTITYLLCLINKSVRWETFYSKWNNELYEGKAMLMLKLITEVKRLGFVPDEDEFKLIKGTHPLLSEIKELIKKKDELQEAE